MRLGAQDCHIKEDTLAARLYESLVIQERHRHRFEFNSTYRKQFEEAGLVISGTTSTEDPLVEMIEITEHPFYIACQFHPEFQSKPNRPHPLFKGFIEACMNEPKVRTNLEEPETP